MSEPMHYESPKPLSKQAAVAVFDKGVPVEVSEALIGLALNEPDWRWVQEVALRYLQGPDEALRMTAATALGHLARLHGTLDLDRVVPALQRLLADPATEGRATDALDDISMFAGGPQPPANRE
jgi:HEAT repeat protein